MDCSDSILQELNPLDSTQWHDIGEYDWDEDESGEYNMMELDTNDGGNRKSEMEEEYGLILLDDDDSGGGMSDKSEATQVEYGLIDLGDEEEDKDDESKADTTHTCCSFRCLDHFSQAEVSQLFTLFQAKSQQDQQQLLLDQILLSGAGEVPFAEATFQLQGRLVCKPAICSILHTSQARLKRVYEMAADGVKKACKPVRTRRKSIKYTHVVSWFDMYTREFGDKMPHIEQIHLPVGHTKKSMYMMMKESLYDMELSKEDILTYEHFTAIWNEEFKHVVIPKKSRFSKCDICVQYSKEKRKLMGKSEAARVLSEGYKRHLKHVDEERKKYYKHRDKARMSPEKYLTVIADGMDQSKTNLPQLPQEAKSTQNLWHLGTHVTGALAHTKSSRGKKVYAFIDLYQWPHDTNITIEVLMQLLGEQETLPPVLYLQMDNSCRENKNRYLLGFCSYLVEMKVFRKIKLNFLPVGHTHEDVDQFFSKISPKIQQGGAETLQKLVHSIEDCFTPKPTVRQLQTVLDVKAWLAPHIDSVHGHSVPLCYKFTLDGTTNKAILSSKRWSHSEWQEHGALLTGLPHGCPVLVQPNTLKMDAVNLRKDIPRWFKWLEPVSVTEWKDFLENILTGIEAPVDQSLAESLWLLHKLQSARQAVTAPPTNSTATAASQQQTMFDSETTETNVYIGRYKPPSQSILAVSSTEQLQPGQFVAVHMQGSVDEPAIGEVVEVMPADEEVTIRWYQGDYSSSWSPYKIPDPKDRRKKYAILIAIASLLQVAAGGWAVRQLYLLPGDSSTDITSRMPLYTQFADIRTAYDHLHMTFSCCGDVLASEWTADVLGTAPDSCCTTFATGCGLNTTGFHTTGCTELLATYRQFQLNIIGPLGLATGIFGILSGVFAPILLVVAICKNKS